MKKMMKALAVIIAVCVIIGAFPLSASAVSNNSPIDYNAQELEYNIATIRTNDGFIWQNQSTVVNNRKDATIHNNQPKANITNNYGRVGSDTVYSQTYGEAGNEGTIDINYGTVSNNFSGAILTRNYGSITGYNYGFLQFNQEGGFLHCNSYTLVGNYGTTEYNTKLGIINTNFGLISEANTGTVQLNRGTIQRNGTALVYDSGKVEKNQGTIIKNANNSQVDMNEGTITDNSGYVRNYAGGVVTNNLSGGRVYNYGGTVTNNSGELYVQVDLSTANATVTYGEGFSSDNDINCWLPVGEYGTATVTPNEGYNIKSIPTGNGITSAVRNDNGSWTVTVGGFDSNVNNETLGITLSDICTITIDCGGYAEDIVVEAKIGDRLSDVFYEAGIYDALSEAETDEVICRGDIASKPLSEFADGDEFFEDTNEIWLGTAKSDVTLYACFLKKIHSVELTLETPAAGDVVTVDEDGVQSPLPKITFAPDSHCYIGSDTDMNWYVSPDDFTPFEGTFAAGERYYTSFFIQSEVGYYLTENTEVKANGATVEDAFGPYAILVTLSTKAAASDVIGAKGAGVVEYKGNFYFVRNDGSLYTNGRMSVSEAKTNGLLPAGAYNFDENGKILCNGIINGYFYINGDKAKGAGIVKYGSSFYFAKNDGTLYTNGRLSIPAAKTNGLLPAGAYNIDENGKILCNGAFNGYYYINGDIAKGAGVVKYGGSLYFVKNDGSVYKNGRLAISEAKTNGLVPAGSYNFDENGKMTDVKRIVKGYYYVNGKKAPAAGLIEYNGDLYYIKNNAAIYTSGQLYITEAKANSLVAEGRYKFDADGKMVR